MMVFSLSLDEISSWRIPANVSNAKAGTANLGSALNIFMMLSTLSTLGGSFYVGSDVLLKNFQLHGQSTAHGHP